MRKFAVLLACIGLVFLSILASPTMTQAEDTTLLTDPFLQLPTHHSVRVVWMTEFPGRKHLVQFGAALGDDLKNVQERDRCARSRRKMPWLRIIEANTTRFSRMREDANSHVPGKVYEGVSERPIWRHEGLVKGLRPGQRVPYRVVSIDDSGKRIVSDVFTLSANPVANAPLKILLTSDHQLKNNTPVNLQKVAETVGQVDAVFVAGDLINVPDRASEWFDDDRGLAFFPGLQGRASFTVTDHAGQTTYHGGELIQHAPLFPVIGNHEVMGRVSDRSLGGQFNDPKPRAVAERAYAQVAETVNPHNNQEIRERWLKEHSFNVDSYEEMFTLPTSRHSGERWYAVTFGNVRLIALYATRIWRNNSTTPTGASKYVENSSTLHDEMEQGWGTHIFERVDVGSVQYEWLARELKSAEFKRAEYHVVMLHHPIHNLGGNVIPAFTDPIRIEERDAAGQLNAVRYEYPIANDYLVRDIQPLLVDAGVELVLNGHSHLWNRFQHADGTHFLETSNVGNNYGAFLAQNGAARAVPGALWNPDNYVAQGDPAGLTAVIPTVAPFNDEAGQPLPYVASNDYTAFSILDTATGDVTTYIFDVREPSSEVRVLDRFNLK